MPGPDLAEGAQALLSRMQQPPLYVCVRTFRDPQRLAAWLEAHLRYMLQLEAEGVLFASGPMHDEAGDATGALTVLRARDAEHARALADADPLVREGIVTYELHRWTVMEGSLQVRVSFGTGTFDLS